MVYTGIGEYIEDIALLPKYVLSAYVLNGGNAEVVAAALGIGVISDTNEAWSRYIQAEDKLLRDTKDSMDAGIFLPYEHVCETFKLNRFERFVLAFFSAISADPVFKELFVKYFGSATMGILLRLYSSSVKECAEIRVQWLQKQDSLRLIFNEMDGNSLKLHAYIESFLLGVVREPKGCELFGSSSILAEPLTDSSIPQQIMRHLSINPHGTMFILQGKRGVGKKYQIKKAANEFKRGILCLNSKRISDADAWRRELEAYLSLTQSMLCICATDLETTRETEIQICDLIDEIKPDNLFLTCETELNIRTVHYTLIHYDIKLPEYRVRVKMWKHFAALYSISEDGLEAIASRYRFTAGQIENVCKQASSHGYSMSDKVSIEDLHEACRKQNAAGVFGKLAVKADARYIWDDIILPDKQLTLLKHICGQVRNLDKVYHSWGFDAKMAYGRGVRALFSGPPGSGKTMAAQVIANELRMDLYKVDMSALVSKYIGETEKNLDELFSRAADCGGILLFDEADAVFGKRGEQKDSHDKYANMQTAFLLQRFEDYDGVVILTTNYAVNLDPAFFRRIQNRIEFPVPTPEYRRRIWESLLIRTAPFSDDVDTEYLAQNFDITGASIKNIILQAAFMAADTDGEIDMGKIIKALIMEYAKTDKILSARELEEYLN